ncbi:MOSC domain-containing protein [Alterisphingorhabdus coralli]|uniref:MOSC domain-containing protein n=1 Tax=Alterisphingorhabdus coralli TaxID=3071408 RepID=A0AA97F5Z4_9SPHN|nr:MOSC domain-containing protein [Parasphingorhabdus sp. SCSIO 66989]WOE74563.1 MOSC domain-containing protein [Parasphingorhabdus sp. SCSIO 66989]
MSIDMPLHQPRFAITSLNVGKARPFRADGTLSAIAKTPVREPQWLGPEGFADDEVADPIHHGGADKAVHLYPQDHYAWWRQQLGDHSLLNGPAAFGENITVQGLTEDKAYLGDRFGIGEAVIEISHGRQPCWKLDHRFGVKGKQGIMAAIIASGRCGLYARVVTPGYVNPDDDLVLLEQGDGDWSIKRLFAVLIGGKHKEQPEALQVLATHPRLAAAWQQRAAKLIK